MSNIDELKDYFNNLEEVKRFKELEKYINNNKNLKALIDSYHQKQKQYVNALEFKQENQAKIYEDELAKLKNEILDIPFVDEYLELIDIINQKLEIVSSELNYKLDKIIND